MNEFDLFQAALDLEDAEARKLFLQSHCEHDAELLNRVEALLASHEGQSRFLETPVVAQIAHLPDAGPVTMLAGNGSTQGDDPESTKAYSTEPAAMPTPQDSSDDEITLGFLDPSSRPDSLGRLGHYEVLEVVGRGAFGTVLRAFDEKLQRVVAIKVMAPEMATTSPARKRFLREARASAAIRHENVVSIYAVEETPLPHLVMEFIPGQTLQQRLNQVGPLNVPTVLRLGRQIAEGLAAAHAQDLIHRDIKPCNILLETGVHDRVKITDFGLARTADDASMTQSGTIAGTPMYMAPEQAMGQKLDQRADLFSFGSVLYQMVSGRPPFRAATTLAVLKRLAEDTPRPIREIIPETPQWLCDIITKLHAKNPDERYQSAREIADVLTDCESQLKTHSGLKDFSLIPQANSLPAAWWKWIAAAVVVLPLVAFGLSALNRPAATIDLVEKREVSREGEAPAEPQIAEKLDSERDDLAKHGSAGASGKVRKSEDRNPDRDVAEWVLKNGGAVLLVNRGGLIENMADLPPDPFTVFHVIIRNQPKFTEADGVRLSQLRGLYIVGFIDSTLEPGSITALARIRSLQELGFSRGMTSNATLSELLVIPQLRTLALGQVAVTDDLVGKLGAVSQLLALQMYACPQVTESGLIRLAASPPPKLQRLEWAAVKLSAAGMKAIASLPHLQTLRFTSMELSDTGLSELADCPSLSEIVLDRSTGITAGAINDFQQKHSGCQVVVTDPEQASPIYGPAYRDTIRKLMSRGFSIGINSNSSLGMTWIQGDTAFPPGDVVFAQHIIFQNLNDQTAPVPEIEDLQMLAQLTDLPGLGVSRLPAGGLRELLPLKNLTLLMLGSSQLTEADFALLPTFRKLSGLLVVIPNKAALETVATLPHLSRLTFGAGSTVADGDLKALESVRTLSTLDFVFTTISREAAQAFANARPDVHVNWKDGIRLEPVIGWHGWHADAPAPAIAPFNSAQAKAHQEAWAKHLGVPVEYTNSIGMKFRLIPPGEFTMGSSAAEIEAAFKDVDLDDIHWKGCIKSEAPQHKVILTQPIYLGVNEVTQAEYEKVMGVNPAHFSPTGEGKEVVAGLETADHPVEMVSWSDAAEFCAKLSKQQQLKPFYVREGETVTPLDGTGYRLPSEAEWEFACRAGTATKYWIGDKDEDLVRAGWFGNPVGGHTHAAGKLNANPFGLFDIHGNVWEWVQDGWEASYYRHSQEKPAINPNNPFSAGSERVFRGGAWDYAASRCRSSGRGAYDKTLRSLLIGFRVSLTIDAVKAATSKPESKPATATGWHGWSADAPQPAIAPFNAEQAQQHPAAWAKYLNVPVEYTNSLGMKFRLIPPGEFLMGTTPEQNALGQKILEGDHNSPDPNISRRLPAEMPQHRVVLTKPFFMAATEVTVARFRKFVDATGYETTADREGSGNTNRSKSDEVPANTRGRNWRKPGVPQAEESPVSQVTWNDACVFCNWLSEQEELTPWYQQGSGGDWQVSPQADGYRLPTEAEWEYACRAGTKTQFSFGDDTADLARYAWHRLSNNDGLQPVGTKLPNPFGLYDMHGNVTEFCQDAHDEKWYGVSPELDPLQKNGTGPVARGGNWYVGPFECRSASRKNYSRTHRYWALGFRIVRPISAAAAKVETKS